MLIGIGSSLQESEPFPFYGVEGMSRELAEARLIVGLPQKSMGAGSSTVVPEMSAEEQGE